jgi:hypothetical protein
MHLNSAGRVKELIRFQARPCSPETEMGLYDVVKVTTGIPCTVTKLGSPEKLPEQCKTFRVQLHTGRHCILSDTYSEINRKYTV